MTNRNNVNLSRANKLLLVIYEISDGIKKNLKFEDIVVAAFRKYPEEFHLRGYNEYPDSGDLIHKPLYDFRKKGLLDANNKVFSLTERGISIASRLQKVLAGKKVVSDGRLSRFAEKEISRIEKTEGFELFINNDISKISDTDFYVYFGASPRTPKNDFIGRLETVNGAIEELARQKDMQPSRKKLLDYHVFITNKFKNIIEYFKNNQNHV